MGDDSVMRNTGAGRGPPLGAGFSGRIASVGRGVSRSLQATGRSSLPAPLVVAASVPRDFPPRAFFLGEPEAYALVVGRGFRQQGVSGRRAVPRRAARAAPSASV